MQQEDMDIILIGAYLQLLRHFALELKISFYFIYVMFNL